MQKALPRNLGPFNANTDAAHSLELMEVTFSCLWILTPLTATVSLFTVLIAIFTNQWLHTEERMANPYFNGTGERNYLSKRTMSGLWAICFTKPGETLYDCNKIDYFSKEDYSPDPNDSTMAIPYTVTRSATFFLSASLLLCTGYCCCIMGQCVRHRTFYTFISGIIFIVTGLIMLLGLVVYISIFKSEVGGKLRPRSQLQAPIFYYWYGYSFLLFVGGLIATQAAGISSIFFFIYKAQYEWRKKQLSAKKRSRSATIDPSMLYPACRRHPQAYINSNSVLHYPVPVYNQKRYYFSKETFPDSPFSVQRQQLYSSSLKDLSNFYDFSPPATISYQIDKRFLSPADRDGSLPRRFFARDITANTISTNVDLNYDDFPSDPYEDYSPSIQNGFFTFDLDQPLPSSAHSNISIVSRFSGRKNFEDSFRRTTPV